METRFMTEKLAALHSMVYPGRVIIIGGHPDGRRAVVVYAVTGRSPASQARRLRLDGRSVWTEPLDEETLKSGNPELLIYRALAVDSAIAVSNGRQTDDIAAALNEAGAAAEPASILSDGLRAWTYEPDPPHFTPRITGCVVRGGRAGLGLIRRGAGGEAERTVSAWKLEPGRARLIATYDGREESPLPSFSGPPRVLEIQEKTARDMAEAAFAAMAPADPDKDYRVSVACLFAPLADLSDSEFHIINHRERQGRHGQNR
jgi:IMP cyclohydrolase